MKRFFILSLTCLLALGLQAQDEYALFTAKANSYKEVAEGCPVISSSPRSFTESLYSASLFPFFVDDEITKITYYGYNIGEEQTRHLTVWMESTEEMDLSSIWGHNGFRQTSEMTKVFEGDCRIPHGGSAEERVALLEIPLSEPFRITEYWLRISIECTGDLSLPLYFEQCDNYRSCYYSTAFPGENYPNPNYSSSAAVEFTLKSKVNYVEGKVKDQDGHPVPNATITLSNGDWKDLSYAGTTNEEGDYRVRVERGTTYYLPRVTAKGHTSFSSDMAIAADTKDYDVTLYNTLYYQAGKRYTIILPVAPDASAGRYFRLNRRENNDIIFEREQNPQAHVPYVFFPSRDVQIDLRQMDLSQEPEILFRSGYTFRGSYEEIHSGYRLESEMFEYLDDDYEPRPDVVYRVQAMHATLIWDILTFGYMGPTFVFHDPADDVPQSLIYPSLNSKHSARPKGTLDPSRTLNCYDLSGRRLSVPSASSVPSVLPKGVYIEDGKKRVRK